MSRNLTTTSPASTYPYLIQTDVETTTGGILTASLQTGLGVPVAHLDVSVATASYALNASVDTSSFVTTSSFNSLTGSFVLTSSYKIDSASWNNSIVDLYTGSTAFYAFSSSYVINSASFSASIAQRVRSVNGIFPDTAGNVAVSIASTQTGPLASRPAVADNATLFVVSNDTNPADNGDAYIFVTSSITPGSGSWEVIAPLDQASSDARYLMIGGGNNMLANLDAGGFKLVNVAPPTLGTDAVNLNYLTGSSVSTASYVLNAQTASYVNLSQTASYVATASTSISASIAQTASYINVTGSGVLVNWNGSQLQLTASVASSTPSLQQVTTVGASSTNSLLISGSLFGTSSFSITASYVSGAVVNYPDPYISSQPVFRIITLTLAEYNAIGVKDPNTFYAAI